MTDEIHEDYEWPKCDWQYEVACGYTILGYWDWVLHCREAEVDAHERR